MIHCKVKLVTLAVAAASVAAASGFLGLIPKAFGCAW